MPPNEAMGPIVSESGCVHVAFPLFISTRFIVTFNCLWSTSTKR